MGRAVRLPRPLPVEGRNAAGSRVVLSGSRTPPTDKLSLTHRVPAAGFGRERVFMDSVPVPESVPVVAGPQDLTSVELGRYGLGVVVRSLRFPGVPLASLLHRVYCLFCGIAIDHQPAGHGWWFCRNACNAEGAL